MNTREIREPFRKIVGWPVENKLLGALGLVLFAMAAWTLNEVQGHSGLLAQAITHQLDIDHKVDAIANEVHDEHKEISDAREAAAALKQRFDDFAAFPKGK